MTKYYVGFDCGTQGTKVAIYADDSTLMAEAYREHKIMYPKPRHAVMDANHIFELVVDGIRECIKKGQVDVNQIKVVSCSGVICGLVPIDENWNAVGPYIFYLDTRATEEADHISKNVEPLWRQQSGNIDVSTITPPVVLSWLIKNDPDLIAHTKKVIPISAYVMGKLAGLKAEDAYIDWGNLSGWFIGYDARARDWSSRQLDLLGLPREILPDITDPAKVIGFLERTAAVNTGLKKGIPLVAGSGDIMQSILGSGATSPGFCTDVAGTSSILTINVRQMNEAITDLHGLIFSMGTLQEDFFYWGYISAGGLSLSWFRDNVLEKTGDDQFFTHLNKLAETVHIGSNALLYFPYLEGEKPSFPNATAAWLGLSGSNSGSHLWRSMLESIAFEYLEWITAFRKEKIEIKEIVGTGGGSKSHLWNQLKADILGIQYKTLKRSEGAVLANALLAAFGVGDINDLRETIGEWIQTKEQYEPIQDNNKRYQEIYQIRQKILNGPLSEIFAILAELRSVCVPSS